VASTQKLPGKNGSFNGIDKVAHRAMLVWCLGNNYTFVALKLAWGEAS